MLISTLTIKGQTTVPEAARTTFALKPGQRLAWEINDGFLTVRPVRDLVDLAGSLKSGKPAVSTAEMKKAVRHGRVGRVARKLGAA